MAARGDISYYRRMRSNPNLQGTNTVGQGGGYAPASADTATTERNPGLFYSGTPAENQNPETLNQWLNTTSATYRSGENRANLQSALYRYSGYQRPDLYMSSQRNMDRQMLEASGLLVNGQLGARSLERMPTAPDLRFTGGEYRGLTPEQTQTLFNSRQQQIYGDLLRTRAQAPTATAASSTISNRPPYDMSRGLREQRRRVARGARTLRGRRMGAGMESGLVPAGPQNRPYGSYDPYRETWWEFGKELVGTDKAGNRWSAADLGIQY